MRTRCPACHTTFRFTAEQLKARAGKVRCGQCQTVFNVLDNLIDEEATAGTPSPAPANAQPTKSPTNPVTTIASAAPATTVAPASLPVPAIEEPAISGEPATISADSPTETHPPLTLPEASPAETNAETDEIDEPVAMEEGEPLSEAEVQELGKATGLILPRETTEIHGYSKWAEGVIAAPMALPEEKNTRWPFVLVAIVLIMALAAQIIFRFRSEIAISLPSLRPLLQTYSEAFNTNLPLPRDVELVSIEQSDLQADPTRGNLLVLNATLRNRAAYEQAYPSLELSLTDTSDAAIARKVFSPAEFLPAGIPANQPFKAKSEISVRLWIEASEISAAGYRLYVFYP